MLDINRIRKGNPSLLVTGSPQPAIIQSILDFDFITGKARPSVSGIVVSTSGRKKERYFWGNEEIFISRFNSIEDIKEETRDTITFFLNMNSGRRALSTTSETLRNLKNLTGGVLFAENMPEQHALKLFGLSKKHEIFILGPASVGLVIPKVIKLGPIAGLPSDNQLQSGIFQSGNVAMFSASGGIVGEIITHLAQTNHFLSFGLTFGGDRFPITQPADAFLAAENDPLTKHIVYCGELGGTDEYELVRLLKEKKVTKPVYAFIAGSVSEMFDTPPQFGHAKAMAKKEEETAQAKQAALREAGCTVAVSFEDFADLLRNIPLSGNSVDSDVTDRLLITKNRKKKMMVSSISYDVNDVTTVLGKDLLARTREDSFGNLISSLFLGRNAVSSEFPAFAEFIFKLLVDNGPYQSGVVNTVVSARAGKDMVSSVSSGLLTIGPRFGGATNDAAKNWFQGANCSIDPYAFVEDFARNGQLIPGIGHLKYRIDLPDPRVSAIEVFADSLPVKKYLTFAREVEKVTLSKKGNLILNVDGIMAAILLDLLSEKELFTRQEIEELISIEFFNAFFVFPRTAGFIAHFLDQKRLDEGLFRLTNDDVGFIKSE